MIFERGLPRPKAEAIAKRLNDAGASAKLVQNDA